MTKSELARVLNVTHSTIIRWISEGKVPLIEVDNKTLIPKNAIPVIKENIGYINTDEYMRLKDFLEFFKISHETFLNWIKRGWIKTSVQYGKNTYIPLSSIDEIKRLSGYVNEEACIDIKQLSSILGVRSEKIFRLIKSGLLVNYHLYKDKFLFKSDSIEDIKQTIGYFDSFNPNEYIRINEAKKKLNLNFDFHYWKTKIPYITHMGTPYIHMKDLTFIFDLINRKEDKTILSEYSVLENYVDTIMAAELLKINRTTVSQLINSGKIKGAVKVSYTPRKTKWMIPMESIEDYKEQRQLSLSDKKKAVSKPANTLQLKITEYPVLENYVDTSKAAELLQINKTTVSQQIKFGKIKGAVKVPYTPRRTKWMIPMESIEDYKEQRCISLSDKRNAVSKPANTLQLKIIAEKTGLSLRTLRNKIRKKQLFPNAQKVGGVYYIPIEEANAFIKNNNQRLYKKKVDIYTNKDALEEILKFMNAFPLPYRLRKTQDLFVDFCKLKLSKLRGAPNHIQSFFGYYQSVFEILSTLEKNLYELDVSLIDSIMTNEITNDHKKRIFNHFYEYCYSYYGQQVPKKYVVSKTKTNEDKDKEIYSPEVFFSYYKYVKDIALHLPNAINDQYYANMWAFTIMHLTDVWRASDIVYNTPKIDISSIQVDSLAWFNTNVLTMTQCQKVINQLYLHFRSIRTSKTNTLVTFLVEPGLVKPLSTALIISELHRQKNGHSFLLESFFRGKKFKSVATSGKDQHHSFFKNESNLEPFKSLKFNNSTMTYLFYSISDEDGNDADVALELTQRVRSHNRAETTAIYVKATNKDDTLNQVSSNLFRRGHFGWLYNYLILLTSEKDDVTRTMEEKTVAISTLRNELGSPFHTERWAQFLLQIKQKRNSVITRLANLRKESLKETIIKIFKGEMSSKTENAQCITHPVCEYPRLNSCYSCPNIIPKNYLFIELSGEFDRLINSIEATQHDAVRRKESYFLLNLLLLLDEGIDFFGEDYVEAFIEIQHVRDKLSQLADKIYIE
nr:helix-turn-helix domain-containing protein [Heyndrickxia shackletonii]